MSKYEPIQSGYVKGSLSEKGALKIKEMEHVKSIIFYQIVLILGVFLIGAFVNKEAWGYLNLLITVLATSIGYFVGKAK